MKITLQTITPLWTGGVERTTDRLHETALIGSLRWWYEALVRGLEGYACDPTEKGHCEYNSQKPDPPEKQLCPVCYLFGTTGWGRKFRLRVTDERSQVIKNALQENTTFVLDFVELRPLSPEEKWLLIKAIWIAVRYGSLGGKTTLKPQKGPMGKDYGITQWIRSNAVEKPHDILLFLNRFRHGKHPPEYADLRHFFFFQGAFLMRLQMNTLMKLDAKGRPLPHPDEVQRFLRGARGTGTRNAVSKKIFSFKANGGRIWGYAKSVRMRDETIARIKQALSDKNYAVKTGEEVLNEL